MGAKRLELSQKGVIVTGDLARAVAHLPQGVNEAVKLLTGWHFVPDFNAADLDQPIAVGWIKAGGFRVQYNFTHRNRHGQRILG